ncbi:dual specificity protein phosphatase cdc14b-like [Pitangus sulphuratus]|nr:dual specificity protein phosphatase cdc14b-like [Pitangus sulphuratus]
MMADIQGSTPLISEVMQGCPALQGSNPWDSTEKVLEEAKVYSPEAQGREFSVCYPDCPEHLQLHHLIVMAAKVALEYYIPHQLFPVGENKVQRSTCGLLNDFCEQFVIATFKKPWGFLVPCHVVPPTDIGVVEIPYEH